MLDFFTNVKKVESLTAKDILTLIENKVIENKRLDYKLLFSIDTDNKKVEFLKDVTALYNSEGGVIIYGIQERKENGKTTGIPELPDVTGHAVLNFESTKLAVISCLKTGTSPAVAIIYFSPLLDVEGHHVFAIGVPKNNSLPVMVTKDNTFSFYRRNNTQKYPMDTLELLNAFLRQGSYFREIEAFVERRLDELYHPYLPAIRKSPQVILHLIPADHLRNVVLPKFFDGDFLEFSQRHFVSQAFDVKNEDAYGLHGLYLLAQKRDSKTPINLDGVLLFRDGIVEVVQTTLFSDWTEGYLYDGAFYADQFANMLIRYIESMLAYCEFMDITSSFYLSLRIRNLAKASLVGPKNSKRGGFNDENLFFPICLITSPSDIQNVLNMLFAILYQAVGEVECPQEYKDTFKNKFSHGTT